MALRGVDPAMIASTNDHGTPASRDDDGPRRREPSSDRLQLVAEALGGFTYDWNLLTGEVWRSAGLETLLGYDPSQVPADAGWWTSLLHPDDREGMTAQSQRVVGDASVSHSTSVYRVRHRDGAWRWISDAARLLRDDGGRCIRMVGVTTDVTDERGQREALRVARERTEGLQRLSADLTRVLSRDQVADVVVRHTLAAFDALACAVLEHRPERGVLVLVGSEGIDERVRQRYAEVSVDAPLPVRDVVREREPVFLRDAAEWNARYGRPPSVLPAGGVVASWAALPLVVDAQLVGALTVTLNGRREFHEEERRFMRAFADLCAQALERARLYEAEHAAREESQRRLAFTQRLQRITAALARALTPQEVTDVVLLEGVDTVRASTGSISLIAEDDDTATTVAAVGWRAQHLWKSYSLRTSGSPGLDVVRGERPVYVTSPDEWRARYPLVADAIAAAGIGSSAALPIIFGGRVQGLIGLSWSDVHVPTDEEHAFLSAIAAQCAQALERSRLYDAERLARAAASAAQRRAEFLADVSRLLASSLDIDETLQSVARAAVPVLGDWCIIDMLADIASDQWPPSLRRVALAHDDPSRLAWARSIEGTIVADWNASVGIARVLREGVVDHVPEIVPSELGAFAINDAHRQALERAQVHGYVCTPIMVRGRALGAITFVSAESRRRIDDADRALAVELSHRVSLAVEHAMLLREAQQASAAKSQFLAVMSHELRTPLNAIDGYAELLELDIHGPLTEEQRNAIGRIRRSQRHLLGLINDVLNLARIESGQVQYQLQTVRVVDALDGVVPFVAPQARAQRLTLDVLPCDPSLAARADAEKLQQVLLNLLSNAVKYTSDGGRITIRHALRGMMIDIAVEDTGIGIPADRLEAVFEPFVQVHTGLTRTKDGTGLGLAISRDLVRGMGGELRVASVVGEGSTFTLSLPVA